MTRTLLVALCTWIGLTGLAWGQPPGDCRPNALTLPAPTWRRKVVYSAAEPGWWHELVADHFPGEAMDFARTMAPRLALDPALLDGQVVQLSTGERQRAALIRALALQPQVLLLDEATGALDEDSTVLVENVLRERLAEGATIAMVTHSAAQAARLGHRQLRMGKVHPVPMHVPRVSADVGNEENSTPDGHEFASVVV